MDGQADLSGTLIAELRAILGDRLSVAESVRAHHGKDESYHTLVAPDAVVFPKSTEEIAAIVRACVRHKTPLIPFGVGTSLPHPAADLARSKRRGRSAGSHSLRADRSPGVDREGGCGMRADCDCSRS